MSKYNWLTAHADDDIVPFDCACLVYDCYDCPYNQICEVAVFEENDDGEETSNEVLYCDYHWPFYTVYVV